MTFTADHLKSNIQLPSDQVGAVLSITGLSGIIVSPLAGFLGDRFGRYKVLLAGTAIVVISIQHSNVAGSSIHQSRNPCGLSACSLQVGLMGVNSVIAAIGARDRGCHHFAVLTGRLTNPHGQLPQPDHPPHRPGTQTENLYDLWYHTLAGDPSHLFVYFGRFTRGFAGRYNLNKCHRISF